MKYREKIVQMEFLDDEERVIRRLQAVYNQSLKDITQKANALQEEIYKIQDKYNSVEDKKERAMLQSMERSKVYQKQYQDTIKTQVNDILDKMHRKEFKTVNEYLNDCYDKAFTGNMYVLHGEGIPLIVPIDQEKVVRAVQVNSKISRGLYLRLGEDIDLLKRKITAQISRGVATGMSYSQMAQQLAGYTKVGYDNAVRITRTEGHRIQQESTMDACYAARERGADVVKQWDATMDANTRESHQMVDGEIRELDEKFSNGLMYPGDSSGNAAEVINCRCVLLQRAKWALDQKELERLEERASFYGLDKVESFDEFKKKYLNVLDKIGTMKSGILPKPTGSENPTYNTFFKLLNEKFKVKYNPVKSFRRQRIEKEIIKKLSGGDTTSGSCASVGLAYIGQKQGWNVLDFRGGNSMDFFSDPNRLRMLFETDGIELITAKGANTATVGKNLLKQCEPGKEYYLFVGRHASIVRKTDEGVLQYLELQSETKSGWTDFDGNVRYTLVHRFGCSGRSNRFSQDVHAMIDLEKSDFETDEFRQLLGYINTALSEQKKGKYGAIK